MNSIKSCGLPFGILMLSGCITEAMVRVHSDDEPEGLERVYRSFQPSLNILPGGLFMNSMRRSVLLGVLGILAGATMSYAQTTVPDQPLLIDPDTGRTVPSVTRSSASELSMSGYSLSWWKNVSWSEDTRASSMWPASAGLRWGRVSRTSME